MHPSNDGADNVGSYSEQFAFQSALAGLSKQVEPTPDPSGDDQAEHGGGGIVNRANEFRSKLTPVMMESLALHGMEISKANQTRAEELYRNTFPHFEPRFTRKCTECGTEFDDDLETCDECGAATREPSQRQRTKAEHFFDSVNKEGQSLRSLYKFLSRDGGRLGVWLHIIKKRYGVWRGQVFEEVLELVRGDPKRIKPVVDENGRIGGHWWACPVHRGPDIKPEQEPGRCEECGAELREVYYAEVDDISDSKPKKVFFEEEVITYAGFEPRLGGHDGLSPVSQIWLKQAILRWMDVYAAGYYDQENTNRYPGRLALLHTSNKQAVEKQLEQAQDEQDEDPYAEGFVYNEVPRDMDASADKAQVLDMMSDEILGQSDQLKKDYKSDIRSVYGLTDVQDSELEDAGGLNNEGLQLAVNDRDKAAVQQELRDGPLQKLMDVLGFDDWQLKFVPPEAPEDETSTLDTARAAAELQQADIPFRIEDGRIELVDTDGTAGGATGADDGDGTADTDTDTGTGIQVTEENAELLQKVGNWLKVNEGRALLGLPPDESETGDDYGAPGRVGAQSDDIEPPGGGGLPDLGDESEAINAAIQDIHSLHEELLWGPTDPGKIEQQAADPFWAEDEAMPEFVQELIEEALNAGVVYARDYKATGVNGEVVEEFFREKLDQPQGWSIRSLAEDFADRFDISFERAVETLRTQLTTVLNEAREQGYRQQGDVDDRDFKWLGPSDERTTRACQWLKEQTDPDHGGEPRSLDELQDLVEEANDRFVDHQGREWAPHINCRHTFVEHFD